MREEERTRVRMYSLGAKGTRTPQKPTVCTRGPYEFVYEFVYDFVYRRYRDLRHKNSLSAQMAAARPMFDKILAPTAGKSPSASSPCRRLGIKTVAVHSDVDVRAQRPGGRRGRQHRPGPSCRVLSPGGHHSRCLPPHRAQAVHPGYGFLSENAEFSEKCAAAGIKF